MSPFVVDASVVLSWVLPNEAGSESERLFDLAVMARLHVPSHFHAEVGNGLLQAVRRQRMTLEDLGFARMTLNRFDWAVHDIGPAAMWGAVITLAGRHQLTVYDAAYVQTAMTLGAPLATFDKAVRRAAEAESVLLA